MDSKNFGETILFSSIMGAIAAPLKLLVHHLFVWTKLASPFYTELNSYLTHGHYQTENLFEGIFVELGDIAIGAMFGILLGLWLKYSRPKYHWWIGLVFGFGIWYITLFFGNITKIIKASETNAWSLLAHLLAMIVFGLLFVMGTRVWRPLKERILNGSWKRE